MDWFRRMALALSALMACAAPACAENLAWRHGQWFDGQRFAAEDWYTVDGRLSRTRPAHLNGEVDLRGRFVTPAFGDAHHHGIDGAADLDTKINAFLTAGIYYVKNPNVIPDLLTPAVRARLKRADSVDVVFANGGLTGPGGHPAPLHDFLARRGIFPGMGPQDMADHAYFAIASQDDLEHKWPRILAGKPDFVKTFLLFSERQGTDFRMHGLDPALLPSIVARAHAAGLRVTAHIETAADFRVAVAAGVDEMAHLPLPRPSFSPDLSAYVIDAASAAAAAKAGVTVVATLGKPGGAQTVIGIGPRPPRDPAREAAEAKAVLANQIANLHTLADAGVRIALGSDGISGEPIFSSTRDTVRYLASNAVFDNASILRLWSEQTAATIFPARRIGRIAEGFEADFLILAGDPLQDLNQVDHIVARVKQGAWLGQAMEVQHGQ